MQNRVLNSCAGAILALLSISGAAHADDSAEFVRLMNRGKGLIENRESAKAMETIEAALAIRPDSAVGLRNLARACLIADKMDVAIAALERAAKIEPNSAATPYLWGIALAHQTEFEKAVPKFEEAARLDAATPAVRFQLALAYQAAGRDKEALTQFKETARLDPMHAAAWFKLATYARQAGDAAEAKRCTQEFTRLRKLFGDTARNSETLESCVHTKAEAVEEATTRPAENATGIEVKFVDATKAAFAKDNGAVRAIALLSVDEDGRPVLVAVDGKGAVTTLRMDSKGEFARTASKLKIDMPQSWASLAVGDFHDDVPTGAKYDAKVHALNDVLVLARERLYLVKQVSQGVFMDVTKAAGLMGPTANAATWADTDHDGDLDLVLATEIGISLFHNNGNGTFADVSKEVGIQSFRDCLGLLAVDLEQNDAIDLVAFRGEQPTIVIGNKRAGLFAMMPEPPGPWTQARRVMADDLDQNGKTDVLLVGAESSVIRWGDFVSPKSLEHPNFKVIGSTLIDLDNDGLLDCVMSGVSGSNSTVDGKWKPPQIGVCKLLMAWRNAGDRRFEEVTSVCGFADFATEIMDDFVAGDFDNDGDSDLVALEPESISLGDPRKLYFLRNDGGNANRQLKLRLLSQKTNPSCYGTQVEVRAGDFFTSRRVDSPVVEIGVGPRVKLDTLQMVWTNGVVDNQFDVAVTKQPIAILEKNVATGSCPFLYAWDGGRFRFVTDVLGNAPIGLPLRRDFLLPADPEEIVVIGGDESLKPRDGRFLLDVTSEFLEVLYLDEARLLAVDHPADVEVHVNDKIMAPPFPPSEVWLLKDARVPVSALGDDGIDRTDAVRAKDDVFAPPGSILPPPYRGMCYPLVITVDFGEMSGEGEPVLALTGWLQYGQASTNIALSQNPDAVVIMPRLEVELEESQWRAVDVDVGMPAGKTKTILADLKGKLPAKFRRLRLTNTFEIRWDRIAMFERVPMEQSAVKSLRPMKADLRWRGFSEIRSRAENHPTTPDYEIVSQKPPWRSSMEGWCTRYGDVMELTAERDNQLAIVNGGDALRLEFDAMGFAPVASGMKRTYLFYSYGWEKDGDYNVERGDFVETELKQSAKGMKYQTRWVGRDQYKD